MNQTYKIEINPIYNSSGEIIDIIAAVTDSYDREVLSLSVIEPHRIVELCKGKNPFDINYTILKHNFQGVSTEVAAQETASLMARIDDEIYTKFAPAKIRAIMLIKHELKAQNMSQKELAIKLSASETQVSNWLAGRVEISIKNFYKICEILGIKFKS